MSGEGKRQALQIKNYPRFFCLVLVAVAFAATLSASLSVPLPIGSDTFWHLNIAHMIHGGNYVDAWNYVLDQNKFPYGFLLFQSFESLFFFCGDPFLVVKVLQVFLLPSTLGLTVWLVYRFHSPKAAVYCGMMLLGSWAFFDGALQVRPESLDLLLYPLVVAAVLAVRRWGFVGLVAVGVYSHGLAALSMYWGLGVARLRERGWLRVLVVGVLIILPVLVTSALYVGGAFVKWGGAPVNENPQEALFWSDPSFAPYYVGAGLFALPFVFVALRDMFASLFHRPVKRVYPVLVSLALWGLIFNTVMLPLWADRWLHYISLPLAIIGGVGITELKKAEHRYYFAMALLVFVIVYVSSYFGFSLGALGHYWQPGD